MSYPDVLVLPLTPHYHSKIHTLQGQSLGFEELFQHTLNYWRFGLWTDDYDEEWVHSQVSVALYEKGDVFLQQLMYMYRESQELAVDMHCDHLTALIMQTAEDLSPLLNTLGDRAEAIQHICRGGVEYDMLLLVCYLYP